MSSGITITVQTLLTWAPLTAVIGQGVYALEAPQNAGPNHVVVRRIFEAEEELLQGASQWPESRVSVECVSDDPAVADNMGELVKDALRDKHLYVIENCEVSFRKEGTDESDGSNPISTSGFQATQRRIIDYYCRWRRLA